MLPARSLATTGAGEPARQAASFQFVKDACLDGRFLSLPACRETLAGATCRQERGGTDATGTAYKEVSGIKLNTGTLLYSYLCCSLSNNCFRNFIAGDNSDSALSLTALGPFP